MRTSQHGFTIIESIVTLVILAAFSSGMLAWLNSSVNTYHKLSKTQEKLAVFRSAVDIVANVNPMLEPEGEIDLPPYVVNWQSEQLAYSKASSEGAGTYYDAGLYRVSVIVHKDSEELGTFSLTLVGSKQTVFPLF